MKKVLSIITVMFLTVIIFSTKVNAIEKKEYVNDNGIAMTENQINNLKNLGFSDLEIQLMELEDFEKNKDLEGKIVATTVKFYKTTYFQNPIDTYSSLSNNNLKSFTEEISEEEYNNADTVSNLDSTPAYTETEYKKLTTNMIAVNGRYRYKVDLEWKKLPSTHSYDIIGIGIDSTVSGISDTKIFSQFYLLSDGWHRDTRGIWALGPGGYAVTFKLMGPTENWLPGGKMVFGLKSSMYFEVQKLTSAKILTLNAYGNYKHAQKSVSSSVSGGVSVGPGGISFNAGVSASVVSSYDYMSTAQATLSGLNW